MTIDQRLERLTERHEALTQSVEMMMRSYDEQNLQQNVRLKAQGDTIDKILVAIKADSDNIAALARIA